VLQRVIQPIIQKVVQIEVATSEPQDDIT